MIHICVFPDTELYFLHKILRMCVVLKYTHIVLEFWGMLKLDAMKELSWDIAFTKSEIKPIIDEVVDAGVEIIPMFNHWGHAAQSRAIHGRHVVLDQNPRKQMYFRKNGWVWDVKKPMVRELMRNVRNELIELCGDGKYFHIGCDEADTLDDMESSNVIEYLNEVSSELKAIGRRPIMWGDMLLYNTELDESDVDAENWRCPSHEIADKFASKLNKDIIIADWHYGIEKAPFTSSLYFKSKGFDVLPASWSEKPKNITACIDTVVDNNLMGVLYTTWHTLGSTIQAFVMNADCCCDRNNIHRKRNWSDCSEITRKVYFSNGDINIAGWPEKENV